MSNKLYRVSYVVDDNDINIENLLETKLSGGQFLHLQSSDGFYVSHKNCSFV